MTVDLVDQLGGRDVLAAAVDDLYRRVLADDVVEPYFCDVDLPDLQAHMVNLLSAVLVGPGTVPADRISDLERAHGSLGVTDDAFDRVAGHLLDTLGSLGVAGDVTDSVVERVSALRPYVV